MCPGHQGAVKLTEMPVGAGQSTQHLVGAQEMVADGTGEAAMRT